MLQRGLEAVLRQFTAADERGADNTKNKVSVECLQARSSEVRNCESTTDTAEKKSKAHHEEESRYDEEFVRDILSRDPVPIDELRGLSRSGCPAGFRYEVWCYLTGHLQPSSLNRAAVLTRKRQEYVGYMQSSYGSTDWDAAFAAVGDSVGNAPGGESGSGGSSLWPSFRSGASGFGSSSLNTPSDSELSILKQIRKDIPRMAAGLAFLSNRRVMLSVERCLYIWALRHPACGYVQGMDDFTIPFISVVLANRVCRTKTVADLYTLDPEEVGALLSVEVISDEEWVSTIEADTYWMVSYFLSAIQENYTYDQRGLHSMVEKLEAVVRAVNVKLYNHLRNDLQIDFKQFSFRWMNCLLLRELNATQVLRLWDAYLADEEKDWCTTHVYTCAAFLQWWSAALLQENDYCVAIKFLQNLPSNELSDRDISAIVSQGIVMQKLYNSALAHLAQ
ncbi:GTPase activating protein, conserved [Trypanosoma equiperdum]|uniref:GTPase activating protein, conserved n=2 Tax=Trypanozoon TaxID=39700 RepID=Q583Q1_TRYB2|nr:GTPase activating protein, conserved [Trypanosoma brucei brucei TREU927]AAX80986.1 GTPase activating protein, conserved [Trypanosoma brucei]AAZ11845.1 GTPase activating protein, conserved [Trypanosoma brucei brucei TREU927]SCU67682.1 GTPase activating protein, conserved [Trypanosoma equiperdum]